LKEQKKTFKTRENEENHMKRMFGFLIGVVVGGLVGSTIALLMAPESGENLRAQIRNRGQNFFNDVRHAADERKIELRQRLESMRAPREG
jgi:gas vesicle protein